MGLQSDLLPFVTYLGNFLSHKRPSQPIPTPLPRELVLPYLNLNMNWSLPLQHLTQKNKKLFVMANKIPKLILGLLCLLLYFGPSSQHDILEQGRELKFREELFSAEGKFKLGFFNLTSNHYYIGIWHNDDNTWRQFGVGCQSRPSDP